MRRHCELKLPANMTAFVGVRNPLLMSMRSTNGSIVDAQISRIGFGCAAIMASLDRDRSLATLHAAFDAGIRHFDVAPSYGYGEAEVLLGSFLDGRRGDCTIATKFGIEPPPRALAQGGVKAAARRLADAVPALRPVLRAAARGIASGRSGPRFEVATAEASLARSLEALRTDHVDLLLMHEPDTADVRDGAMRTFLAEAMASGRAGAVGIGMGTGSDATEITEILRVLPGDHVVQFADCIGDQRALLDDVAAHPAITHSVLRRGLTVLEDRSRNGDLDASLKDHDPAAVLLKCALDRNPTGRVLFSSRDPARIIGTMDALRALCADPQASDAVSRLATP